MKSIAAEIMEGKYDNEKAECGQESFEGGALEFSCSNLELSLKAGETAEGSFMISGPADGLMEGRLYSSELRMECLNKEFIGVKEEILYRFRSEGMEEGDTLEGKFCIISNYGEYEIPYRVSIEGGSIDSSLGNIKNTFHFANLAKSNWEEAVKIFYSEDFKKIFMCGNDRQFYSSYKCLSAVRGNEQNVEEFLLEINKKQRVEYIPEKTEIYIEDPQDISEHGFIITRNGWGHTFLNIQAEGEFITTEKREISDDEFLGNTFRLIFYIDSGKLHGGRNFGGIHIFNSYVDITIPVTSVKNAEYRRAVGIRREKKRILVQLMQYYEAFRTKKISARTWMGETEKLIDRLAALDEKDVRTRLFQAQLLITQERYNEAKWQLDRIKEEVCEEISPPEIWCYYLYLTTLYSREDAYVDEVSVTVERTCRMHPDNWRIAWLLLYLSEEYSKSPSKRWLLLEEQFKQRCTSPVLYVEAWHLLELNPTLLMKLGDFEIQVLNFAARRELLSQDMIMQIRYLALKMKVYSERVFCILKECYEKSPDNDTLQAVCTHLIKGNKTDSRYFKWYRLSVEQELRITKLYEYYMMSLPADYKEELPKVILMYFAYHSELDYKKNAFLYSYIYRRREKQPELYLNYCERIERFVLEQIHNGRMNEDLAYLYKNTISSGMVNEKTAKELASLLFMNRIRIRDKSIKQVIVGYTVSKEELRYPVSAGKAWVPLYGSDYKLLMEDSYGNRYSVSVPFEVEKMLLPGRLVQLISPYVTDHIGLDIYVCEGNHSLIQVTEENVKRFRSMADCEHIEEEVRSEIRLKLVHYYYEQDYMRELDGYLEELEPDGMGDKERNEILRLMVLRGMYDKAMEWVKRFGAHGTEVKTIVRLCSRLISRDGFMEDEDMTYAVYYAFRKGRYDGNLITYLVYFYHGLLKQMRDVWKAAEAFEIDTYNLCERILVQMLYTGSFIGERMEIFRKYVSGGAKAPIESAFLSRCSCDYFIGDKVIDEFIFTAAVRMYGRGEKLHKVCKLALLKYYAGNKEGITAGILTAIKMFLYEMLEDNIYFPFYKEYVKEIPAMEQFMDKTMIEYKASPGSRAVIHYMIERGQYTESEYRTEEMRDMYGGVCVKAFVLFFGEKLQYYITEEAEGKEQLTVSDSVSKSDILQETDESRFNMINDIVVAKTLQDYSTADCLLEEYYRKEYMISQIFHLR